jgi:spermidine/putrescine transport system permease protein
VVWAFSLEGWVGILWSKDIFDRQLCLADAHLTIFWRSVAVASDHDLHLLVGFPTAWFIATRPGQARALWLFLITIPFWTNLLIRTYAINEVIRNEGLMNTVLLGSVVIDEPIQMIYTDTAILIGMTYVYLPLMVLPLFAAIDRFDMRCWRRAMTFTPAAGSAAPGHPADRQARHHRRVDPGLRASLGAYVTPRVLGGGKQMMIGNFIELQFLQGKNWPWARRCR